MKILSSYFLIVLAMSLSVNTVAQRNVLIGVNVGLNYSQYIDKNSAGYYENNFGYLAGLDVECPIYDKLYLKLNFNFERIRFRFNFKNIPPSDPNDPLFLDLEAISRHDYFSIPILLKYQFGESKIFFINGGGFWRYLLGAKVKTENKDEIDFSAGIENQELGM